MRINNTIYSVMPMNKANAYKSNNEYRNTIPKVDSAYISPIGNDLALVRNVLKDIPDVREDKINEIKEKINNGTYQVSVEDLANKLLGL